MTQTRRLDDATRVRRSDLDTYVADLPRRGRGVTQIMAFLFGRGFAAVWCGPQSNDAEVVAVNLTADVAAAHSALTGVRHAPYFSLGDARPYDLCPDRCWRCNAVQGETDVGLCAPCHADLTNPTQRVARAFEFPPPPEPDVHRSSERASDGSRRGRRARCRALVRPRTQVEMPPGAPRGVGDDGRERHGAHARGRLRRRQVRRVAGQQHELLSDVKRPAQEVDVLYREPERLTLSQPRSGGEDDVRPIAVRYREGEGLDLLDRERLDLLALALGQLNPGARRHRDEPVGYRGLLDGRDVAVGGRDRASGEHVGTALYPRLHVRRSHRSERSFAEERYDVIPKVGVDLRRGRSSMDLRGLPPARVVAERSPAGARVDVGAAHDVAPYSVELPVGVELAGEALRPPLAIVG